MRLSFFSVYMTGESNTGTQTHFHRSGDKTSALLDLRKVNWDHFCPSVHHSAAESLTNTDFSENEERCGVESFWLKVSGVMTKRVNSRSRSNHASYLFLLLLNKVHVWCMYIKENNLSSPKRFSILFIWFWHFFYSSKSTYIQGLTYIYIYGI